MLMNRTCKNTSETGLRFSNSNFNLRCTKYNLGFQLCRINRSINEVSYEKDEQYQSISKSYDNKCNPTYTKYSFFPAHLNTHVKNKYKDQKSGEEPKKIQDIVKWVGVKGVDQLDVDRSYLNRNAFPQRKTKGSDQMIMNLLIKYEKHYGRKNDDHPLSSLSSIHKEDHTPKHMKLRQKKNTERLKWFKSKNKG